MIIRVRAIENNKSSYKFSINKDDAVDLGLESGQRWEIEIKRQITPEIIRKELEEKQ